MIQDIYNFNPISERLGTSGMPTRAQIFDIQHEGYEVVIDLSQTESSHHLPEEAELVNSLGMEYIHIPVVWEAPRLEDLENFFQALEARSDRKIFVHCVANYRVSVFVYLYRLIRLHARDEIARADLQRIWSPDGIWLDFIDQAKKEYLDDRS